jgi:hypothetical protein
LYTDNAEAAYMQKRADTSRIMAQTAGNDCARKVHELLAAGYEQQLAALRRPAAQA